MSYTDDPLMDFERWDRAQNELLEGLPVCDHCDNPIQSDYYEINDSIICEDCMETHYKRYI